MRTFKSRAFAQFTSKNRVDDADLCRIVASMQLGAIDADLGGGVYKQRLRRAGQGKSGGFRTIVVLRFGEIALFVFGFAKSDQANIARNDLMGYRKFAKEVFQYDQEQIKELIVSGAIEEICVQTAPVSVADV